MALLQTSLRHTMSADIHAAAPRSKDPPRIILRFFKILQNEEYSQILHLPPAFARKVKHLVDQETYLENSGGQRWAVKISKVDDSMAFHGGWNEFFTQQSLVVGQFLEFHYIKGSHFLVLVYGRSGCERINLNRGLNIAKADNKVAAEYEPIQKFCASPNSKLKKRVRKRPRESSEKDVREDKESQSILRKKKESHVMQNAGWFGKSDGAPTIIRRAQSEPLDILVDVPILCAENYNCSDLSNLGNIKALANLAANLPEVVSGLQTGESSKASLPDAAKNAEPRTKSNTRASP